jgi:rhodanese-related sulfurtransferase
MTLISLSTVRFALAAAWLAASGAQAANVSVLVNPGDFNEQARHTRYQALAGAVADALREARAGEAQPQMSLDATADLSATRAQMHDVFVAPAHVVASALRHGYVPLAGNSQAVQAVLVSLADSRITTLQQAAGKRLGLPMPDSVVTYLVRGEVNAANTSIKSHFGRVSHFRWQEALLVCLKIRECDVAAVERTAFERWKAAGEPVVAVLQSRPVPGIAVAVKQTLADTPAMRALQPALLRTLATPAVGRSGLENPSAVGREHFEYVATLGYFTPRQLPGATVVDAEAVAKLVAEGALYVDTRTEAEFKNGHVPGSRLVPYVEKSAKDTDFDVRADSFDTKQLPPDKSAALIFACNGAECWKSYKASHAAIKAGYQKVYWFRGGLPEWRSAKRQVASSAP